MIRPLVFFAALLLAAPALSDGRLPVRPAAKVPVLATPVSFIAFGDAGDGGAAQYAVGRAVAEVCAVRGCDFALMLGDNFYPDGVTSADDPQFISKFERPYAALTVPVYVALGNQDNGARASENRRGDFQVAYAQRSDRLSD